MARTSLILSSTLGLVSPRNRSSASSSTVVPGTAFGKCGEGFVRVSYSYSLTHISEALGRIGEFLQEFFLPPLEKKGQYPSW